MSEYKNTQDGSDRVTNIAINNISEKMISRPKFEVRKQKAIEQSNLKPTPAGRVISLIKDFLGTDVNLQSIDESDYQDVDWHARLIGFKTHQYPNGGTFLWLKFTKTGHLGVVAKSTFRAPDINFARNNTSGKLVEAAGMEWDCSHVYIFPLGHGDTYKSSVQEQEVGEMLIKNNVPIIDYYSHNW